MKRKIGRLMAALCIASLVGACADNVPLRDPSTLTSVPVYRLGPGDNVRVTVFNETNMSGDFAVSDAGTLGMPLLGPVKASGLTVEELRQAITTGLGNGYVNNPRVTAQVVSFRPYFVMGEVTQPGRYPLEDGMTLVRAIATAGGFTYRANEKYAYLRRQGESETKLPMNADFQILPGDVIRIGERHF